MAHRRELLLEFATLFAEAADFHGTVEAFDALLAREELADLVAPADRAAVVHMGRDPDRIGRILDDNARLN
jgi:hypothetical protein